MIASLNGEVVSKTEHDLVILVGGLGLRVLVPKAVSAATTVGEKIFLFTALIVREDSMTLFGFKQEQELDLFNKLLSISGVGPKTALSILSTLPFETIISAALANHAEVFSQVPGIGLKSAQKIIIYLHDKVSQLPGKELLTSYKDVNAEVIDALIGLGYSVVEAQSALQSIPRDAPQDLENRLRIALQYFST